MQERAAPSRSGPAQSGPHQVELQQGPYSHISPGTDRLAVTHAPFPVRGGPSPGAVRGGVVNDPYFGVLTAVLSPRVGATEMG